MSDPIEQVQELLNKIEQVQELLNKIKERTKLVMSRVEDEINPVTIDDIWFIDDLVNQIQDITR